MAHLMRLQAKMGSSRLKLLGIVMSRLQDCRNLKKVSSLIDYCGTSTGLHSADVLLCFKF